MVYHGKDSLSPAEESPSFIQEDYEFVSERFPVFLTEIADVLPSL